MKLRGVALRELYRAIPVWLSGLKEGADRLRRERNKLDSDSDKLRAENDRLRVESDRLRAESDRKSAALAQLEQQLTKRFKIALDDAFEEVLGAPVMHDEAATNPSQEDGAGPTVPEEQEEEEDTNNTNTVATGPGEAAPLPMEADGDKEGVKAQENALEAAIRCRSDAPAA